MKVFFISPIDHESPGLFQTFRKTFIEQGHSIVTDINEADTVFFDFHSGLFNYDWAIIGTAIARNLPVICFDAFDHWTGNGEVGENVYDFANPPTNKHWAIALRLFREHGLLKVVFMRKMSKALKYPDFVFPFELIMYEDHDFPTTNPEDLFSRPFEICFIGNKATPRNNVCNELQNHFKCDFRLGEERLPHEEWLTRHRQSKLFLECGGGGESQGGFGSERVFQLMNISPMLEVITEQLRLHAFTNGINCLKVSEYPTDNEIYYIDKILKNKKRLYEIYISGINYMKEYYNSEYRANYILGILKQEGVC